MGTVLKGILRSGLVANDVLQTGECKENPLMSQAARAVGIDQDAPVPQHNITHTIILGLDIITPQRTPQFSTPPSHTIQHNTPWLSQLLNPTQPLPRASLFDDTPTTPVTDNQPDPAGACASGSPSQAEAHSASVREEIDSSGDEYLAWWPLPDGTTPQETTPTIVYHSRAHLPDDSQEALLADTGAHDGTAGEYWVNRQDALARAAGSTPVYTPLQKTLRVQGVGKEAQEVDYKVQMPGRLETGGDISYEAPVIPKSHVPALAGMKTFERLNGTLDYRTTERKLYIGNDYKIVPGPNTQVIQMYPAISGHLMIPISRFDLKSRRTQSTMPLISEEAPPASTATSSTDPTPPMQYQ